MTHGSPELDADAAKLLAMGVDPGPTLADLRILELEHALAGARGWIAPDAERPGVSEGFQQFAIELLSEIDALLKGTIYERPQEEQQ